MVEVFEGRKAELRRWKTDEGILHVNTIAAAHLCVPLLITAGCYVIMVWVLAPYPILPSKNALPQTIYKNTFTLQR